jgi:hypothetical protein
MRKALTLQRRAAEAEQAPAEQAPAEPAYRSLMDAE